MPKKRGRGGFDPDFNPNRGGGRVGRGRGESSTRGSNRGGGRGRGVSPGGRGGYAHSSAEIDVVVQMWPQNGSTRGSGYNTPRGAGIGSPLRGGRGRGFGYESHRGGFGGRGRGGYRGRGVELPYRTFQGRGNFTPAKTTRGRGDWDSPHHGGGRGYRGGPKTRGRSTAPLSQLLYGERPYLKPIAFVPSGFLFNDEEEIFKPGVEEIDDEEEQSHAPTANRVFRVFSGGELPHDLGHQVDSAGEEVLEEVDFSELGRFHEQLDFSSLPTASQPLSDMDQEKFTGVIASKANTDDVEHEYEDMVDSANTTAEITEKLDNFIIESEPSSFIVNPDGSVEHASTEDVPGTQDLPADEEVVVYPRSTTGTPLLGSAELSTSHGPGMTSILTGLPIGARNEAMVEDVLFDPTPAPVHIASLPSKDVPQTGEMLTSETDTPVISMAPPATEIPQPEPTAATDAQDEATVEQMLTSPLFKSLAPPAEDLPAPDEPEHSYKHGGYPIHIEETVFDQSTASTPAKPVGGPNAPSFIPLFASESFSRPSPKSIKGHKTKAALRAHRKEIRQTRKARSKLRMHLQLGARGQEFIEIDAEAERYEGSDIDWGTESESDHSPVNGRMKGKGKEREMSETEGPSAAQDIANGEMTVDSDVDMSAMQSFANSFSQERSKFVTMDDLADMERMKVEDEEGVGRATSSHGDSDSGSDQDEEESEEDLQRDLEEILAFEEEMMLGEIDDGSDDDIDFDMEGTSFEARLNRLREASANFKGKGKGKGKGKQRMVESEDDDADDADGVMDQWEWSDGDEELMLQVQEMLDENEDILSSRDKKAKKAVFRSVLDGSFDRDEWMPATKRKKDKAADLPPELRAQWEKDRQKKAAKREAREMERLMAAADPLGPHKGGKKGRKAMRAAAGLDPEITVLPNRIMDMTTLVQRIQTFLSDIGGPQSMSLPPMEKGTRKKVHELAIAFGLKSISKGGGNNRYTTLTKTTRSSSANVNYAKVQKIVRKSGGRFGVPAGAAAYQRTSGKTGTRTLEGEEVGKAAPKIGETNLGFKMLASMGWSEGDRIGATGGLRDPLKAVIKNTKLGLGATR